MKYLKDGTAGRYFGSTRTTFPQFKHRPSTHCMIRRNFAPLNPVAKFIANGLSHPREHVARPVLIRLCVYLRNIGLGVCQCDLGV